MSSRFSQPFREAPPCSRDLCIDSVDRDAKHRGDFTVRKAFERQRYRLPHAERKTTHRGEQSFAPLLLIGVMRWIRRRIDPIVGQFIGSRTASLDQYMTRTAVVRDARDKCSQRCVTAKIRQRLPEGIGDVLAQIVSARRISLVARGDATDQSGMRAQDIVEIFVD